MGFLIWKICGSGYKSYLEKILLEIWLLPDRRKSLLRSPSTWHRERRTSGRRRWWGGWGWWWRWCSRGRHRVDWPARPLVRRGRSRAWVSSEEWRSSAAVPAWCLLQPRTQSSPAWRDLPRRICRPPGTKSRRWSSACPSHLILTEVLLLLNLYIVTVASLVVRLKDYVPSQFPVYNETTESDDIIWIFLKPF